MATFSSSSLMFFTLSLIACFLATSTVVVPAMARPITSTRPTLLARLRLDQSGANGTKGCWDSLFELQACTGEVILFFLNGETYLGPSCCRAIEKIERHCWPTMLGSLGFTAQEGELLLGYCDTNTPPLASDAGHVASTNVKLG